MTARKQRPDRQIEAQVERLVDENGEHHSREEIERLAKASASELKHAPDKQPVPDLVYNDVKTRLAEETAEKQRELA